MQHVLTTEQLMQIHEALTQPTRWFAYKKQWDHCPYCNADSLREPAAKLVEDILNAECAKGEPQ